MVIAVIAVAAWPPSAVIALDVRLHPGPAAGIRPGDGQHATKVLVSAGSVHGSSFHIVEPIAMRKYIP